MQDENTVSAAFYLAVLDNSLDVLASALRAASAAQPGDSFHLSEAPVALEEAREAVTALRSEHSERAAISPEAAA